MSNPNVAFTLRIRLSNRRPVIVPPLGRKPTYQDRIAHEDAVKWNKECALIVITCYDGNITTQFGSRGGWDSAGRVKLTVEVKHGQDVIFPVGQLCCALHGSSDGMAAKELVMSLVAMKPGDTDRDYFADYTPEQLAWATEHGEALDMEREARYCDANGAVRKAPERRKYDTLHAIATAAAMRRARKAG
jgi:hypothetical protein